MRKRQQQRHRARRGAPDACGVWPLWHSRLARFLPPCGGGRGGGGGASRQTWWWC